MTKENTEKLSPDPEPQAVDAVAGSGTKKFNRRTVGALLKKSYGCLLVAGALTVAATGQSVKDRIENVLCQDEIRLDIAAYISLLQMRYGLSVSLPQTDGEDSEYSKIEGLNMLRWTIDVLGLFPDEMIRGKLLSIELGEGFSAKELGNGGRHHVTVDLKRKFPRVIEETAFKSVMLHELQHFFDAPLTGEKGVAAFPEWEGLNPDDHTYDSGTGASADYPLFSEYGRQDGLVFGYQRKNSAEDRAVLAQVLFAPTYVQSLVEGQDPYIAAKLESLRTFYYDLSKGKMDDTYWRNYQEGKVDSFYWTVQ